MVCAVCSAAMREGASRCAQCGARPGDPPPVERAAGGPAGQAVSASSYPARKFPRSTYWHVLTDRPHTVELKVSALTGREVVAIDGREVANALNWSLSNTHALQLGDQRGELSIKAGFPTPRVTLTVGGREVPPVSTAGTVRSSTPTPVWVYPFAGLCFAIPIVTLGGALPMGLGFGAGAACLGIARKEEHEMALGVRVAACAAITIAAWGVLVALLLAVARSRAG